MRVLISGGFHDDDMKFISGPEKLSVIKYASMDKIEDLNKLFKELNNVDIAIFRLMGDNPENFILRLQSSNFLSSFKKIKCKKVFWSQDSHHMHNKETKAEPFFDRLYIAHKNYLKFFPKTAYYLPCCYSKTSIGALWAINHTNFLKVRDVIFPYVIYPGFERNIFAYDSFKYLKNIGVHFIFARAYGNVDSTSLFSNMLYGIKTSKICLNLSLTDDFNMRNFEAISMNSILLTNRVVDHNNKHMLDYRNTFFFEKNIESFRNALELALDHEEIQSVWRCIPGKNMLTDRYLKIINNEFGSDYCTRISKDHFIKTTSIYIPKNYFLDSHPEVIVYDSQRLFEEALLSLIKAKKLDEIYNKILDASNEDFDLKESIENIILKVNDLEVDSEIYLYLGSIAATLGIHTFSYFIETLDKFFINNFTKIYKKFVKNNRLLFDYKVSKDLFFVSLHGLGINNYKNIEMSGERQFLRQFLKKFDRPVVFDVGANSGQYSREVLLVNNKSIIYAFEPNPVSYTKLKLLSRSCNFFSFNFGFSSVDEDVFLFDRSDDVGSVHASLYSNVISKVHGKEPIQVKVKLMKIDDFINKLGINTVNLLKIDAEGHEFNILLGAEKSLKNGFFDVIHFEFNEMNIFSKVHLKNFIDILSEYKLFRLLPDGMVCMNDQPIVLQELYAYQKIIAIRNTKFFQFSQQ